MDEDYIRFQASLESNRRTVLLRPSKRHFASVKAALCQRQSGTLSAVETYFRQNQKEQLPRTAMRAGGAENRLFNTLRKFQRVASPVPNVTKRACLVNRNFIVVYFILCLRQDFLPRCSVVCVHFTFSLLNARYRLLIG